jgi:hypothetical protein
LPFVVRWLTVCAISFIGGGGFATLLTLGQQHFGDAHPAADATRQAAFSHQTGYFAGGPVYTRPRPNPLPTAREVWDCEVVVVGGSLGGVAAAAQAMEAGANTCLIELTPWLGGQVSAQGVSAIDESHAFLTESTPSASWSTFKQLIQKQPVDLPSWSQVNGQPVADLNSCWVGRLCFPPQAGATAAQQLLQQAASKAPGSRFETAIAFKGADFDATGTEITAIHAVRRIPRQPDYVPQGRFSSELASWYSWTANDTFEKVPIRLQAPPGKRLIVIDATDTGELVAWAGIPHRVGTESRASTGEPSASDRDNPDCTQAFTYPFVLAIHDDKGLSLAALAHVKPDYSKAEHRRAYNLEGFPFFSGHSFFNYRRIISTTPNDPFNSTPNPGDMTLVNWNNGNDWSWMNPPLILTDEQIEKTGQRQNWMGGLSVVALRQAETHALLFAEWLLETQPKAGFPLTFLTGAHTPMGTVSGLSMTPYIREARRIIGRRAYSQREFALRESDLRHDLPGRDFTPSTVGVVHYAIDMHGCKYRNWEPTGEANSAPAKESVVRPLHIPLEALVPQEVNNLLIGGKSIAVTHIANAVTRIHYSEWTIGAAAGATAGWLLHTQPHLTPADIVPKQKIASLQAHLQAHGLRLEW